tara:strand:- start:289 stop:534 length:246 start_codon:yes stop_codon:yes gene_type:complete
MKPSYYFNDLEITPVEKITQRYDSKKEKHFDLKKPKITRGKTIKVNQCHDLFDLVEEIKYHSKEADHNTYLEIKVNVEEMF